MNILVLDFETYFSDDYTLKKMTTEAYIRDPRFEALLLGWRRIRTGGDASGWVPQEDIAPFLEGVDWPNTAVLCHHAHFDGLILSHHYGVKPALWLDTLSMARLVHGNSISVGLDALAARYGLSGKTTPYDLFRGRRWADLGEDVRHSLGTGCVQDVGLCWQLFQRMAAGYPASEYKIIDLTVRMFTEPQLEGDAPLFESIAEEEHMRKNELLLELGTDAKQLQSAAKFCELLEAEGVEVEWKQGKNDAIPAIAKSDDFMRSLTEHENPRVVALSTARLEVRSTIDETRAGRLASMAGRGPMPAYLGYCGAHTTRWSGGDKVNLQNLPRGGRLRRGLRAPAGNLLAVVDKSQIECRLLNMVAGETEVIERFRNGIDPYIGIASDFYGFPVTKAQPKERGTGKQLELSCGYGAGGPSIVRTAKLGTYGPPVELTEAQGLVARDLYRGTHPRVVQLWREGNGVLPALANGLNRTWADVVELRDHQIILPNGCPMHYDLEWREFDTPVGVKRGWMRKTRQGWRKIWGGHLVENLIQALARVDMSDTLLRIDAAGGPRPALLSHDEGLFVIPADQHAAATLKWLVEEFRRPPTWLPSIPLDAEGSLSAVYEK